MELTLALITEDHGAVTEGVHGKLRAATHVALCCIMLRVTTAAQQCLMLRTVFALYGDCESTQVRALVSQDERSRTTSRCLPSFPVTCLSWGCTAGLPCCRGGCKSKGRTSSCRGIGCRGRTSSSLARHRIIRLTLQKQCRIAEFAIARTRQQYDMKNVKHLVASLPQMAEYWHCQE